MFLIIYISLISCTIYSLASTFVSERILGISAPGSSSLESTDTSEPGKCDNSVVSKREESAKLVSAARNPVIPDGNSDGVLPSRDTDFPDAKNIPCKQESSAPSGEYVNNDRNDKGSNEDEFCSDRNIFVFLNSSGKDK